MKNWSIIKKVTLWYTGLMLLLVLLVLSFMVSASDDIMASEARTRLTKIVEHNMDEAEYDDGEIEIDDDFRYYDDGVYAAVYNSGGGLVAGQFPEGLAIDAPLIDGNLETIEINGSLYYYYDREITFKKHDSLWVRGIAPVSDNAQTIRTIMTSAFIALPFLVLFAAGGGYVITKRSFAPVDQISRSAQAISEGKDLSKRIQLGPGNDEIHQMADTIDKMLDRLEKSFEAERQFSADASHELRTPVAVIRSQCEYTMQYADGISDYQEAMTVIERQSQKMSRIVTQLLTITRMDQGLEKTEFEDTDLSDFVQAICQEQAQTQIKGIILSEKIEPGIFCRIEHTLFARLLTNLITNAYKYGKENGYILVKLSQKPQTDEVELVVEDNGIGIAKEEQEKVWRRFYQVNQARSNQEDGSMGLGLAMVQQIAQLHQGNVTLESTLGVGSQFTFRFPKRLNRKIN